MHMPRTPVYACVRLCTPCAPAMYDSGRKAKFSARFVGFCTPLHSSYAFVRLRAPACACVRLRVLACACLRLCTPVARKIYNFEIAGAHCRRTRRTQAYTGVQRRNLAGTVF